MNPAVYTASLQQYMQKYFGQLDPGSLAALIQKLDWIELLSGNVLIHKGDPGDSMFILLSGRLSVFIDDPTGKPNMVGAVYRGESVGEMALLTDHPRTATVKASRDSVLVKIGQEDFESLCQQFPSILKEFSRTLVSRLQSSNEQLVNRLKPNIALVPLHEMAGFEGFVEQLRDTFWDSAPTQLINANLINLELEIEADQLDKPDNQSKIDKWLAEVDTRDFYSLYQAPTELSYWTKKCVRQADIVYLVVDATQPLPYGEQLDYLLKRRSRHAELDYVLILLHPNGDQLPRQTRDWLVYLEPLHHFHIRLDQAKDFRRLARYMTNEAIGMACGGGGAKGMAHIGVFKALRELGVEVDMVAGTSIGAIAVASMALDWKWKEMEQVARSAFLEGKLSSDFTIPLIALLKGRNKERVLRQYFDYQIEDLWYNYLCVSCDLSTNRINIHDRGNLWEAMAASSAIPGVYPPSIWQKHYLVDGALVNNVPGDILLKRNCARLINIDVGTSREMYAEVEQFPSNLKVLGKRLMGQKRTLPSMPGIVQIFMRSTFLASAHHAQQVNAMADIVLKPPVKHIGVLDWKKLEEAIEAGYRHTMEHVETHGMPFGQEKQVENSLA